MSLRAAVGVLVGCFGLAFAPATHAQTSYPFPFYDLGESLHGLVEGVAVIPLLEASGSTAPGGEVTFRLDGVPASSAGVLVAGLSAANTPLGVNGTLVPAADLIINYITDSNGVFEFQSSWPAELPPGTSLYIQTWTQVLDSSSMQLRFLSNALEVRAFTTSEQQALEDLTQDYHDELARYGSSREPLMVELTALMGDSRVTELMSQLEAATGLALFPDYDGCTIDLILKPDAGIHVNTEIYFLPVRRTDLPGIVVSVIYAHTVGPTAVALLPGGDGSAPNQFRFLSPESVAVYDAIQLNFSALGEYLGAEGIASTDDRSRDPCLEFGPDSFECWASSGSPVEDLPWWYHLLCGVACGSALTGNPLSISVCVHCLGGYVVQCAYDGGLL